eukprot:TRINITY_DN15155_c0_g1_i1.p1 TRINITY_DN15155_c0_g1~~TRINITY_DN15155_c0_g1_i1.p1  ORF type:complete len:206 (-),score=44.79 TRINITY_DN15155_c0_g1_i1:89-706(-)
MSHGISPPALPGAASPKEWYAALLRQVEAVLEGERYWVSNLSNVSAIVYHALRERFGEAKVNWCGFYVVDDVERELLVLGPFQGKLACMRIPFNRGVCGAAATQQRTVVVPNVHEFPGHIACDSASESELVVPMLIAHQEARFLAELVEPDSKKRKQQTVLGVFDLDSPTPNAWTDDDRVGIEAIVRATVQASDWPAAKLRVNLF